MRHRRNRKPLGTMTLILTAGIFLIMLTVMTLQGFLMYLYWRIFYQADIPIPQFWRPIPLLAVLSAVVGAGLTLLLSRIPLKPIRDLIEAINQLADGNFKVRIHLDLNREFERLSESFNNGRLYLFSCFYFRNSEARTSQTRLDKTRQTDLFHYFLVRNRLSLAQQQ